jgi:hypothetical protein
MGKNFTSASPINYDSRGSSGEESIYYVYDNEKINNISIEKHCN